MIKLLWWKVLAALGLGRIVYPYIMTTEHEGRRLVMRRVIFSSKLDADLWGTFREEARQEIGPFVVQWSLELPPEFQRTPRPKRYEYRARYRLFKPFVSVALIVFLSFSGLVAYAVSVDGGWNEYACLFTLLVFVFALAMDQLNDDVAGTLEQGDM